MWVACENEGVRGKNIGSVGKMKKTMGKMQVAWENEGVYGKNIGNVGKCEMKETMG